MSSKSKKEKGKRSGATIATEDLRKGADGYDDPDAAFDAAHSPGSSTEETAKKASVGKKKSRTSVRFSLDNAKSVAVVDESLTALEAPAKSVRTMIKGDRPSLSPSEISRASTAPPKPHKKEEEDKEDDEDEEVEAEEQQETQEDLGTSSPQADGTPQEVDEDDNFPMTQDDNNDDDEVDDLMPPAPDSPEQDDPQEDEVPTSQESPASFPNPDDDSDVDHKSGKDGNGFGDDDDDEDKDGDAYAMMDGDGTITPEQQSRKSKSKKMKKRDESSDDDESADAHKMAEAKKKKKDMKKRKADDLSETSSPRKKAKVKTKSRTKTTKTFGANFPKGYAMPREYTTVPVSDLKAPRGSDEKALRRSQRAHMRPLEFWKGERITWGPYDEFSDNPMYDSLVNMPVPKAIERAEPTPYKVRPSRPKKTESDEATKSSKPSKKSRAKGNGVVDMEPFDNSKIRKKYPGMVFDGDEAFLWDEAIDEPSELKVIGYKDSLPDRPLPMGAGRQKSEGKVVCRAAQAFNISNADTIYPGYLMGNLILPPRGIKDAESVGTCAQTFTCVYGQPGAIEVAYGDPEVRDGTLDPATASRFFVKQGDMFRIPPGNCYRLENHSKDAEGYLTWTIIRPSEA